VEKPAGRGGAVIGFALGIRGANLRAVDHSPAGLARAGFDDSIFAGEADGEAEVEGSSTRVEMEDEGVADVATVGSDCPLPNLIPL